MNAALHLSALLLSALSTRHSALFWRSARFSHVALFALSALSTQHSALFALAGLVILQGLLSVIEGVRHYGYVLKALRQPEEPTSPQAPKVAIIAPCKGIDPGLEGNLDALFELEYSDYQVIFVVADASDPCRALIERVMARNTSRSPLLGIAGPSAGRGEKVNNLLHALDRASSACE